MFKNILVATDMVTRVDAPVLTAIDLAAQYGAGLNILHVLESASTEDRDLVKHFKSNGELQVSNGYLEKVRHAMVKTYGTGLTGPGKRELHITTGYPWEEILGLGRKIDADLIILGPHSGKAEEKGVIRVAGKIGSTVQAVVGQQDCPVMIVNNPVQKEKLKFRKIVVGVDFSMACECALCFSVKLSQNFHSILYPFFMLPIPPYPKYGRSDYETDMDVLKQKLEEFCHTYLDGTEHEYRMWGGVLPHEEVLKCAEKIDADLIILGSHTRERSGKWYGGSVVERVSFRANCPVFVVNDPKALQKMQGIRIPDSSEKEGMNRSIHLFNRPPGGKKEK
ncbi:MAG: universal stress protein [Desulfobacteraceae bacterium]|nr:universal stress protein [Desulfobacteraceae bacterium]